MNTPPISVDPVVSSAISLNAPVAIGVSGGKDSQAAAIATFRHLDAVGHQGRRILIHADLGSVEWNDSLRVCEEMSTHFGAELVVVSRKAGGLMERWEARWRSSRDRYAMMETVTLVPCWSTPSMRFCTSELKTHVITRELKQRFPGQTVINVTGVRREESARRSREDISDTKPGLINWRPVLDWTGDEVFSAIDASGMRPHPAYHSFGMSRVSCRFCIMSNVSDLTAAAAREESRDLYLRMVRLEAESSFAFQGARWLGDVAPHLLGPDLAEALAVGKANAAARKRIEADIPKGLLYVSGWPLRVPDLEEARLMAAARREICAMFRIESEFLGSFSVIERHRELISQRSETLLKRKPARRAA